MPAKKSGQTNAGKQTEKLSPSDVKSIQEAGKQAADEATKHGQPPAKPVSGAAPIKARSIKPGETTVVRKNQLAYELSMVSPAMASFSVISTRTFGKIAMGMKLGTPRPLKVRIGFNEDNTSLYLLPTKKEDNAGFPVTYDRNRLLINLIEPFTGLDRTVPEGQREYYVLRPTEGPVQLDDGYTAPGLEMSLRIDRTESIGQMAPESLEKVRATREVTKAKKQAQAEAKFKAELEAKLAELKAIKNSGDVSAAEEHDPTEGED